MRKRIVLCLTGCLALGIGYVALTSGGRERRSREEELIYLRAAVPDDLLEVAHFDVSSLEAIKIGGTGADRYLGLRVFPGQYKVHSGVRAEVSVDYPYHAGDRVRYTWKFQIPEGFKTDAPDNRWWVIGQWHDQPDARRSETWDGFPSRSPPVLLALGELNGRVGVGLSYGLTTNDAPQQKPDPIWVERGKWYRVAVEIQWSQGTDGAATVFLDEEPKPRISVQGPNMNNGYQHYWKLGQYRHPDIATDNWIYVDALSAAHVPPTTAQAMNREIHHQ